MSFLVLGALALAHAAAPTISVDSLLQKNLQARGGADELAAIHSLRLEGRLLVNGGQLTLQWVEIKSRPDRIRQEATLQGLTSISAWDGTESWRVNPFGGRKDPERVPLEDSKGLLEQAAIDGVLVDAKSHGWPMRYLGTEDIDGTDAHKIQIDRPGGDLEYVWLDPDAFLEIRIVSRRTEHGVTVEAQTDYGDYEKVGDVYFPLLVEFGPKGGSDADRAKVLVDKATPNQAVDETILAFPVAK